MKRKSNQNVTSGFLLGFPEVTHYGKFYGF